jgi:two-component system chemotaxis response regulator CheY
MRVLIIDDSRAIRMILGRDMRGLGFEVFEAGNGLEALDKLQEIGVVDLALVDWNMPEMNGYEFLCAARAKDELADMRIMMVTTEAEISQMVKALEAGANEYVIKPFNKEAIEEKIRLIGLIS